MSSKPGEHTSALVFCLLLAGGATSLDLGTTTLLFLLTTGLTLEVTLEMGQLCFVENVSAGAEVNDDLSRNIGNTPHNLAQLATQVLANPLARVLNLVENHEHHVDSLWLVEEELEPRGLPQYL